MHRIYEEQPLTEDMWPAVEGALLLAYGPTAVRLMRWLITDSDDIANRLDEISPMLDPVSDPNPRIARWADPCLRK
jgi:hypothetical protein